MTDAQGAEIVEFFGRKVARISILSFNTAHTDEHYGNLVTYMRLKGIVPPSSEKKKLNLVQSLRYRNRVLALLALLLVITYLDRVCISVAGPRMQEALGIRPLRLGMGHGHFHSLVRVV